MSVIKRKKTTLEIHIFKSLAFLAVVLQSVIMSVIGLPSVNDEQGVILGLLFNFVRFSAPIFVFIAGFYFFYHYGKKTNYNRYVTHKAKELLIPYAVWSIIYCVMLPKSSISEVGKVLLIGDAAPHLWYVIMIFQFHLLSQVVYNSYSYLENHVHSFTNLFKVMFAFAFIYFIYLWISAHFIYNGEPITSLKPLLYLDRSFLSYLFYFILGAVVSKTLRWWRRFVLKNITFTIFAFIIFYLYINYELFSFNGIEHLNLKASTYIKPSMFLYVLSELIILYAFSAVIISQRSLLRSLLLYISHFTYGAYLSHYFFLLIGIQLFEKSFAYTSPLLIVAYLFTFTVVTSISFSSILCHKSYLAFIAGPIEKRRYSFRRMIQPIFSRIH